MKKLLLLLLLSACANLESIPNDYSYTCEWYVYKGEKYQVYKTKTGKPYIILINKKETKLKRKFI